MKIQTWAFLAVLVFAGAIAWQIGERLSSDAISMGLGVAFGVLAGVPTALLVMASNRRDDRPTQPQQAPQNPPPVIILTGSQPQALPHDVRHHVVLPDRGFYDVQPQHSREQTRHEHYYEIEQTGSGEVIRRGGVRRRP